ncbi:hypothetical protein GGI10_005717, partial [Coemansia sp. RSA 2530]
RLSAEELHEQEVEEDEREVEANTKRFKNFSVQPVGTRSMSKEKLQLQQPPSAFAASPPVRVSPTPAPAAPAVVSAQSETSMFAPSKPATLSANPVATPSAAKQQESNEDGDEDDDIPDIVMEGSDSEDE